MVGEIYSSLHFFDVKSDNDLHQRLFGPKCEKHTKITIYSFSVLKHNKNEKLLKYDKIIMVPRTDVIH